MITSEETHAVAPQASERYPLSDDYFRQEAVEAMLEVCRQAAASRRKGGVPGMLRGNLTFAAELTEEMDAGYKKRLIEHQHGLLMEALDDPQLQDFIAIPSPVEVDWTSRDGEALKTLFIRLNKDIALAEVTYVDEDHQPIAYRPMIWIGRDALNEFVLTHITGADFGRSYYS
jgi:hypothetical protein